MMKGGEQSRKEEQSRAEDRRRRIGQGRRHGLVGEHALQQFLCLSSTHHPSNQRKEDGLGTWGCERLAGARRKERGRGRREEEREAGEDIGKRRRKEEQQQKGGTDLIPWTRRQGRALGSRKAEFFCSHRT
eukprot:425261-Hanusia_phi.AAC.1